MIRESAYPSIVTHVSGAMSSRVELSHFGRETLDAVGAETKYGPIVTSAERTVRFPYHVTILVVRCERGRQRRRCDQERSRRVKHDMRVGPGPRHRLHRQMPVQLNIWYPLDQARALHRSRSARQKIQRGHRSRRLTSSEYSRKSPLDSHSEHVVKA
jgi:hypothetical protein